MITPHLAKRTTTAKPVAMLAVVAALSSSCAAPAHAPLNSSPDARAFMALQHFERLNHYHTESTLSYRGRVTQENTTVFRPDEDALYLPKMHQIDVRVAGQNWIEKDGTWTKCEKSAQDFGRSNEPAYSRQFMQRSVNRSAITRQQNETMDGVPVAHFHFVTRPGDEDRSSSTSDVWIGIRDGLPRKSIVSRRGGVFTEHFTSFGRGLTFPNPPADYSSPAVKCGF